MSKTGAHMINRKDCETLISVSEMIDNKESYLRTDAERTFKAWFDAYLQRLLLTEDKRKEYAARQNNDLNP